MPNEPAVADDKSVGSKWIRNPDGEIRRIGCLLIGVIVGLMFLSGQFDLLIDIPFHLLAGWYRFSNRWSESGQIVWPDVALAAVLLALLTFGIHHFARWLTKNLKRRGGDGAATDPVPESVGSTEPSVGGDESRVLKWRWSLTLKLTAAVLVLFLAGTAMLGMAHQTLWLAGTQGQIFENTSHEFYGRAHGRHSLKTIGEGFLKHDEATSSQVDSTRTTDDSPRPAQSWVTQLLPWRGPEAVRLDDQLKRDVHWNAHANHRVMQTPIPELQGRYSGRKTTDEGFATAHFAGNVHAFSYGRFLQRRQFTDGTANTLLVGETRFRHKAWGDPTNLRDPTLGINQSPNGFGSHSTRGVLFSMADGSVHDLSEKIDPVVLQALSTPTGAEVVPDHSW